MSGLEFEQKFVLDPRKAAEIRSELSARIWPGKSGYVSAIRQFYDKDGARYRSCFCHHTGTTTFLLETKKSFKIGTTYSITLEQDQTVSEETFERGWEKYRSSRLQKTRFTLPGRYPDHQIMIDFFYMDNQDKEIYAVIAEAETMLTPDTTTLYLHFSLPIYLERYSLLTVNDTDSNMKIFKSTNMVDQPENIEAVKRAISRLYD